MQLNAGIIEQVMKTNNRIIRQVIKNNDSIKQVIKNNDSIRQVIKK